MKNRTNFLLELMFSLNQKSLLGSSHLRPQSSLENFLTAIILRQDSQVLLHIA